MKLTDIIKTPVRVEGNLIYELMDSATRTGKPIQVNKWTASVQGENSEELAHAIAIAINCHDRLVERLAELVGDCDEDFFRDYYSREHIDALRALLAEATGETEPKETK